MQRRRPAIVPDTIGADVHAADLIGTKLAEEQVFTIRRKNRTVHMGPILPRHVRPTDAGNQQRIQRADATILSHAIRRQRPPAIIRDGKNAAVGAHIARILASERDRRCCRGGSVRRVRGRRSGARRGTRARRSGRKDARRLGVQKIKAIAGPTPCIDRGRCIRHLAHRIDGVPMDSQVRRVRHRRLGNGARSIHPVRNSFRDNHFARVLVELIGIKPVAVRADEHRKDIRPVAGCGQQKNKQNPGQRLSHISLNFKRLQITLCS